MLKVVKIFAINVFLTSFLLYGSSIKFFLVPCNIHKGAVSECLVLNHWFATLYRHCGCEGHVDHNVVCECTHHVCNSGYSWSPSSLYPGGPVALWSAIIVYELTYSLSFSQEVTGPEVQGPVYTCAYTFLLQYCNQKPSCPSFFTVVGQLCVCLCGMGTTMLTRLRQNFVYGWTTFG